MKTILDKMPKRLLQIMIGHGLTFGIGCDEYGVYLDLNTGMKSHAYLYYENNKYILRMRYEAQEVVETLGDVRWLVTQCKYGRDYMNSAWNIPYKEGFGEFSDEPLDYLEFKD